MSIKRRYLPIRDSELAYHETLDRLAALSEIISGSVRPTVYSTIMDKQNIMGLIVAREGNEDRVYYRNGVQQPALLPLIEEKLYELNEEFAEVQRSYKKQGKIIPDKMLPDMLDKKLRLEAEMDVNLAELKILTQSLAEFTDKEQIESQERVLKFGLSQFGRLRDGVLVELDGQRISALSDGELFIDDPRSPYNDLKVLEYRRLSNEWKAARQVAAQMDYLKAVEIARFFEKPN